MFMMSWRNPDARHADWGVDTYVQAVLDALDAVERITGTEQTVLGAGSARAASSPASPPRTSPRPTGWPGLGLAVSVLDQVRRACRPVGRPYLAAAAKAMSTRWATSTGARSARCSPGAPRRPGLELLGQQLPARPAAAGLRHPVLERRHHRMTARLHADFVDIAMRNPLANQAAHGARRRRSTSSGRCGLLRGRRVADHITPWQSCYRDTLSCSVATTGSCCPRAATSRRWSTPPATRRRRI